MAPARWPHVACRHDRTDPPPHATQRNALPAAVSDDDVVASFEDSVKEGGLLREYLLHGQLAYVAGDALFVHGGLIGRFKSTRQPDEEATDCLGYIPGQRGRIKDVREWAAALNTWGRTQVADWVAQPEWSTPAKIKRLPQLSQLPPHAATDNRGLRRDRGGDALMDYCVPTSEPSAVMGRHLDGSSMPMQLPAEVGQPANQTYCKRSCQSLTGLSTCPPTCRSQQRWSRREFGGSSSVTAGPKLPIEIATHCAVAPGHQLWPVAHSSHVLQGTLRTETARL